jgi:tape measure domain-containing protein
MAQYNIQFSSNASTISKQLSRLQADIARLGITRTDIKLKLDTADFTRAIDSSFKELDKAISKAERRLRKLPIGSSEFAMEAGQAGQLRGERERGRMMASAIGSREAAQAFDTGSLARYERALESLQIQASLIAPNTREWVNLQRNIGTIRGEMQKASKTAESIQLRETLGAFSPGSLNQLQARLTILKTRAYDITPNTTAWKQLNKEIQRTESSIKKLSKPPLTAGQRAGAAGGAFLYGGGLGGGAGSALGGIAGGLMGGVPGAFTGAALGQLTDNMGQALGATASYTAEIDKQRIALRNVTKDVGEYQNALAFIDATSRNLAIPQDVLNKQFTQIAASVIGAGGNVDAAKEAFLGIAAGIRGTGGSLADMQGALLATSQVFSKGKVSAEELRQQIGERLPGAFTLFAQSMGKTPQELDKMLEQGQVTLNDFMGFVRLLSSEYGASASEIAASSQAAGDRLATTMSRMREAVGRELQPLGAQFQEIFAKFFEEAEPGMVAFAQGFSRAIMAIGGAAKAFQEFMQPIRDFIATYPPIFSAFWDSIASDVSELASKIQAPINAIVDFWQRAWRGLQSSTRAALQGIGIDANWLAGEFEKIISWLQNAWSNAFSFIAGRWRQTVENMVNYSNPLAAALKGLGVDVGKAVADGFEAGMSGGGLPGAPSAPAPPVTTSTFAFPGGDDPSGGGGGGKGAQPPVDRTIELTEQLNLLIKMGEQEAKIRDLQFEGRDLLVVLAEQDKALLQIDFDRVRELRSANYESERAVINAIAQVKEAQLLIETEQKLRDVENQRFQNELQIQQAIRDSVEPFRQLTAEQELQAQHSKTYGRLLSEGILPAEAERIANFEKMAAMALKDLNFQIGIKEAELEAAKKANARTVELKGQLDLLKAQKNAIEGVAQAGPGEGKTDAQRIQEALNVSKAALNELIDPINQLVNAANAIGDAFGNAFKEILTGSMSVREALAGMFRSIADHFADMVAKMIAEWLKAQMIQGFAGLFSAALPGMGAAFGTGGPSFNAGAFSGPALSSGSAFGAGGAPNLSSAFGAGSSSVGTAFSGVKLFANGGIVKGPTLGLVGEGRYNEAIVPLPDGKSIPVDLGGAAGGNAAPISTNIVVNVKNGQAESQMTGNQGNQLARELEGAVRQVILKETRPGGLIPSSR